MTLYHTGGKPWHLLDAVQQLYSDTWCPDWCAYTYFKPHQKGTLLISIGREGYNGSYPAGAGDDRRRHGPHRQARTRRGSSTSTSTSTTS